MSRQSDRLQRNPAWRTRIRVCVTTRECRSWDLTHLHPKTDPWPQRWDQCVNHTTARTDNYTTLTIANYIQRSISDEFTYVNLLFLQDCGTKTDRKCVWSHKSASLRAHFPHVTQQIHTHLQFESEKLKTRLHNWEDPYVSGLCASFRFVSLLYYHMQ